jgi:hypothetical protein
MLVLILYWLTFSSEYISYYLLSFFSIVIIWNPRKYLTCIYLILLTTPPSFEYRYGSANISFMASALILPLGNLVFALPFVPGSMPLKDSDIAGLLVLLFGLYVYRFGNTNQCCTNMRRIIMKCKPYWRRRRRVGGSRRANPVLSMAMTEHQFEWDAPVFNDDRNESSTTRSALREPLLLTPIR